MARASDFTCQMKTCGYNGVEKFADNVIVLDETLLLKTQQRLLPKAGLEQMTRDKSLSCLRMNERTIENVIDSPNIGDSCSC